METIKDYNFRRLRKIKVRGLPFYIMPRYTHHYVENEYEEFTADLCARYLKKGDVVVDVGAHYGFYSLLAAQKLGKRGKVHAFEPVEENYKILQKNIKTNKFSNVKTYQTAVSDTAGFEPFKITEASDSAGFYEHPLTRTLREVEVKTVRLDDYFSKQKVSLLKIDTEGNELKVLEGARRTIKYNKEIKLLVELNPKLLRNAGYQPEDLLNLLIGLNFEVFLIDDERKRFYRITEGIVAWKELFGDRKYVNLFCIPTGVALSVLFVSHSSLRGGAERSLLELIDGLQKRGVLCHAVLPSNGPLEEDLEARAVSYDTLPYSWWCAYDKRSAEKIEREVVKNLDATAKIGRLVKQYNPHVVISNTSVIPWGALAAALARKPHVWKVHEFGKDDFGFVFDLIPYRSCLRMIDSLSNVVLTNSKAVTEHLSKVIKRSKLINVYNFVQIDQSKIKAKGGQRFFRYKDSLKLIIVGTIHEGKGQYEALLAVNELRNKNLKVELLIVGPAPPSQQKYLEKINKMIDKEDLHEYVKVLGYVDNPYPLTKQSDVLLVCSRREAFGRSTVEAMLLKKPVIGTNSGGTKELIQDSMNGFLYEPGDYKELAKKIEFFHRNRDRLSKFGENGFKFAKKAFTDKNTSGRIYAKLLTLKKEGNPLKDYQDCFIAIGVLLEDKELEISKLKEEISKLKTGKEEEIGKRGEELAGIYNSRAWRFVTILRKIKYSIPIVRDL